MNVAPPEPGQPTKPAERLVVLDSIRGIALIGILFVNLTWFTGFAVIFGMTPDRIAELGTLEIDTRVNWMVTWLVDSKFWSMFALLFGIGLGMQLVKLQESNQGVSLPVRRLLVLLLIGLAHGIFLWFGDIIALYAAVGFLFLLFARLSRGMLLGCALFFLLLPILQSGIWLTLIYPTLHQGGSWRPDLGHGPVELLANFSDGTMWEAFQANWAYFTKRWLRAICEGRFYKLLGMFLLGYWLVRNGWLADVAGHRWKWLALAAFATPVGLILNMFYANSGGGLILPMDGVEMVQVVNQTIGIPILACGFFATLVLLISARPGFLIFQVFAMVGRLSLTNYIAQSLICIIVFYGCCLGQWGAFGITWSLAVVLLFLLGQSAFSFLWLRAFRFGPLEWMARCLTYGNWLSLKRTSRPVDSTTGSVV